MDDLIIISEQRPTRADAVRNRDMLLCVARRMFDAYGVDAVTMTAIAHEAKVGKGTLYRNFPDKQSLCRELLDQEQRELQQDTLARLRAPGEPFEHLVWFIDNVLAFVWRNLQILQISDALPLAHPAHYWWRLTIRGLLQRINPAVDLDYLADTLFVLLDPRVIQYQRDARGYSMERISDALARTARRLLDSDT
ncbi:MAG: TetR/AcrR family transcriptional regulator [Chloroflexi bacterium]|nr:TetR/AcrR family transcriptional regulator [Chloroflexota bacterium]